MTRPSPSANTEAGPAAAMSRAAGARLLHRPATEPPLVSLHAVVRSLCQPGGGGEDLLRRHAAPRVELAEAVEHLPDEVRAVEDALVAAFALRRGRGAPATEDRALTSMVLGWFLTAAHACLLDERRALAPTFDEIVARSVHALSGLAPGRVGPGR